MLEAFLVSTGIVALAEIGDKTQLLSFVLAARFRRPWPIIWGIFVATALNHALAGAVGEHPGLAGLASGLSSALAMLTTVMFAVLTGALYRGGPGTIALLMALGAAGVALAARISCARR